MRRGRTLSLTNALENATKVAFTNMQKAFEGEAERLGLKTEQDVVAMVDEVRQEMWDKLYPD